MSPHPVPIGSKVAERAQKEEESTKHPVLQCAAASLEARIANRPAQLPLQCLHKKPVQGDGSDQQLVSPLINVPLDENCLLWSVSLAYLIPVKDEDNEFKKRFTKLFSNVKSCDSVQELIRLYNPSLMSGDIFYDKTMTNLIWKFRMNLLDYMKEKATFFEISSDYVKYIKTTNTWLGNQEVKAISSMVGITIIVPPDRYEPEVPDDNSSCEIRLSTDVDKTSKKNVTHYSYILKHTETESVDLPNVDQAELQYDEHSAEAVELLCREDLTKFKSTFENITYELPTKHIVPFVDEFLIYSFLGSAATFPFNVAQKLGVKEVYCYLNLESNSGKFIRLLFIITEKDTVKLVIRTVLVNTVAIEDDQKQHPGEREKLKPNVLLEPEDDEIQDIKSICQNIDVSKIDATVLNIKFKRTSAKRKGTKNECRFEITQDKNLKEALKNWSGPHSNQNCKRFQVVRNFCKSELRDGFDMLSEQKGREIQGVKKIFTHLILKSREFERYFPSKDSKTSGFQNFMESRFHGFIYGAIQLNLKNMYQINCYAERRSGRSGGADLIFISRKDDDMNRSLCAIPVVVEVKSQKNAKTEALPQAKKEVLTCLRTFSEKAIVVGISQFDVITGLTNGWSPLEVEEMVITYPKDLTTLILHPMDRTTLKLLSEYTDILIQRLKNELECLYYSIPGYDRADYLNTYLSRLILGEVLTINDERLDKYIVQYNKASTRNDNRLDKVIKEVTTFVLIDKRSDCLAIVLNIIESYLKPNEDEQLIAIPSLSKIKGILDCKKNVYQIDVRVLTKAKFFYKNTSPDSYCQYIKVENISQKKCNEHQCHFTRLKTVRCFMRDEQEQLRAVDLHTLKGDLSEALFDCKNIIVHDVYSNKIIDKTCQIDEKKTQYNFQAVLHGLFLVGANRPCDLGKKNGGKNIRNSKVRGKKVRVTSRPLLTSSPSPAPTGQIVCKAKTSNEIVKVLSQTDVGFGKHPANLLVSITEKDREIVRENEFIAISIQDELSIEADKLALSNLTEKMKAKVFRLKFNGGSKRKGHLLVSTFEQALIKHPSVLDKMRNLVLNYIHKGFETQLTDLLADEEKRTKVMSNTRLLRTAFELSIFRKKFIFSDLFLKYSISEEQKQLMLNGTNEAGATFLSRASIKGEWSVVEYLIANDAFLVARSPSQEVPLHFAIEARKTNVARHFIEKNYKKDNINEVDAQERTPLHIAASVGDKIIVDVLIKMGADVNARNNARDTPLHNAAQSGNRRVVYHLLKKGADVHAQNGMNYTPLHYAAQSCNEPIVKRLLRKGAYVNAKNLWAKTPLHYAAQKGKNMVDLLLKKGADVNAEDSEDNNPLHYAAQSFNRCIVDLLLEKNADVNAENREGNTPLHCAAQDGAEPIVDLLIENDAEVDVSNADGYTPLHYAAEWDHEDVVDLLIKKNAHVNAQDWNMNTPLHHAAQNGAKSVVKLLIVKDANVNARNWKDNTPLYLALKGDNKDIVDLLITHGADIYCKNHKGNTPLHRAAKYSDEVAVNLLIRKGAGINAPNGEGNTPLHIAALEGQVDMVCRLVNLGAEVNAKNAKGNTPLHIAAQLGNQIAVDYLIEGNADVDLGNNEGNTPLHIAAQEGEGCVVDSLIEKGADIDDWNCERNTPLHIAALEGKESMVYVLVDLHADVNAKNAKGNTPLHIAAQKNEGSIVSLLIEYHADVNSRNAEGNTPLHCACEFNSYDVVCSLVEAEAKNYRNGQSKVPRDLTNSDEIVALLSERFSSRVEPPIESMRLRHPTIQLRKTQWNFAKPKPYIKLVQSQHN